MMQQTPQLIPQGALKLRWPFRDVPNGGKGDVPLYSVPLGAASPAPGKVNLDKKLPSVERNTWEGLSYELSTDTIPRTWGNSCLVPTGGDLGGRPQRPP